MQMPDGGTMYDVHMVEDDWHEEKGIPVWKPSGNEVDGGWQENFPKTDDGASNIYENVKAKAEKSGDYKEFNEFMKACPKGTEFYIESGEKLYVLRKCDEEYWESADITKQWDDKINEWMNSDNPASMSDDWSQYDKGIWKRCENAGLNKHATITEARNLLLGDGCMLTQVGNKKPDGSTASVKEITETFEKMKKDREWAEMPDYLETIPSGIELYDNKNDVTLRKRDDGEWDFINWNGEVVAQLTSIELPTYFKSGESDWNVEASPMGELDKKAMEIKESGDRDAAEDFFDAMAEGTIIEIPETGQLLKKVVSPKTGYAHWESDDDNYSVSQSIISMFLVSDPNYIPKVKHLGGAKKEETPKTPAEKYEDFKSHETYGGVDAKLMEFHESGDDEACKKWLKGIPEGTVLEEYGGGYFTCLGNGKWEWFHDGKTYSESNGVDNDLVAYSLTQPSVSFGVKSLPVKVPDNAIDADKVLTGMKNYNPGQIKEYAHALPNGTMVMDVEAGYVYCKNNGKWEALNYEFDEPNFDPQNDWSEYSDYTLTDIDQDSIPKKFKNEGSFVLKLGGGK